VKDQLPPLRDVVRSHGLQPRKSLGQNFIFDLNLTARIARAAAPLIGSTVVEIGPGPGGLTRALLAQGADRVIAIERDERCLAALAEIGAHYPGRLLIRSGDARAMNLATLAAGRRPLQIVANLPYNIGTALLTQWLESEPWPPWFDRLTLMFQQEVAARIVATPAARADYGRLAVLCGWRTQARILFPVAATAFSPPPKVASALVQLVPRAKPLACDLRALSRITQAAFGQRRKMLRQSLRSIADPTILLSRAGIDGARRAEEIAVEDFVRLARALGEV
jgi:16S rRNA (adenine1518-N6/adenine1519-N6)-dimethyltransferase